MISLQPCGEMWLRSACRTLVPSGSTRTSSSPVISIRPSGSQLVAQPSPSGPRRPPRCCRRGRRRRSPRSPVREPQPAVVPARRLRHRQAVEQHARLHAPSFVAVTDKTRRMAQVHRVGAYPSVGEEPWPASSTSSGSSKRGANRDQAVRLGPGCPRAAVSSRLNSRGSAGSESQPICESRPRLVRERRFASAHVWKVPVRPRRTRAAMWKQEELGRVARRSRRHRDECGSP